jgi:hypothetical protein
MIKITCPDLDELTKTMERQGKELPKEYDALLERLVDEAKWTADAFYDKAADYVHHDDFKRPQVRYDKVDVGDYIITAEGDEVCFFEFGAGYAASPMGFANEMPFPVYPGSWSVSHKRHFTEKGYWFSPNGHYYTTIPPTRAMYTAAQNLLRRLDTGDFEGVIK